jgi:hypothetical protein
MQWHKAFDTRQLREIKFAKIYKRDFSHGTDGHNAKMIIAQMAELLDAVEPSGAFPGKIWHGESTNEGSK